MYTDEAFSKLYNISYYKIYSVVTNVVLIEGVKIYSIILKMSLHFV